MRIRGSVKTKWHNWLQPPGAPASWLCESFRSSRHTLDSLDVVNPTRACCQDFLKRFPSLWWTGKGFLLLLLTQSVITLARWNHTVFFFSFFFFVILCFHSPFSSVFSFCVFVDLPPEHFWIFMNIFTKMKMSVTVGGSECLYKGADCCDDDDKKKNTCKTLFWFLAKAAE